MAGACEFNGHARWQPHRIWGDRKQGGGRGIEQGVEMNRDGAGLTTSINIAGLSVGDLKNVESAPLRRLLEELFGLDADREPSAGFDSSI
jgi:hypothetical protein